MGRGMKATTAMRSPVLPSGDADGIFPPAARRRGEGIGWASRSTVLLKSVVGWAERSRGDTEGEGNEGHNRDAVGCGDDVDPG